MKLLVEGLLLALVLIVELVGLVALAHYAGTTREMYPPAAQGLAIVASEDGEAYQWVEWDGSSCEVWGVQRKSDMKSDIVEATFVSESATEDCRVHIRPHLATTRHPGVVARPTDGHRAEPTSENSSSSHLGE